MVRGKYGTEVRNELLKATTHPYCIILDHKEYEKLATDEQELITTKYHEETEVMGLIAITKGDEILIGIEIQVAEADRIKRLSMRTVK